MTEILTKKQWRETGERAEKATLGVFFENAREDIARLVATCDSLEAALDEKHAKLVEVADKLQATRTQLAGYEKAFATLRAVPCVEGDGKTTCIASEPGNAWDIIIKDRDEWKAVAELNATAAREANAKLATAEAERDAAKALTAEYEGILLAAARLEKRAEDAEAKLAAAEDEKRRLLEVERAARRYRKSDLGGGFNDRVECGRDLDAALAPAPDAEVKS